MCSAISDRFISFGGPGRDALGPRRSATADQTPASTKGRNFRQILFCLMGEPRQLRQFLSGFLLVLGSFTEFVLARYHLMKERYFIGQDSKNIR